MDTELRCRVCLNINDLMINIYDEVEEFQADLSELLEDCGGLMVEKDDDFPKYLCEECTSELLTSAKFRDKCRKTKELLAKITFTSASEDERKFQDEEAKQMFIEEDFLFDSENETKIMVNTENVELELIEEEVIKEEIPTQTDDDFFSDDCIVFDDGDIVCDEIIAEDDEPQCSVEEIDVPKEKLTNQDTLEKCKIVQLFPTKKVTAGVSNTQFVLNCKCDICGAGFTQFQNLLRHLSSHNPAAIYMCQKCSHYFTKTEELEKHNVEHFKEAQLEAYESIVQEVTTDTEHDDYFPLKDQDVSLVPVIPMKVPLKKITGKNIPKKQHPCTFCEKICGTQSALAIHIRIHTGDRPFKCTQCEKAFKTQGALDLHLKRHSGDRPYKCEVCNKTFFETSNLKAHMRTHTGERPHVCTTCGRGFTRVYLLQLHQRTHTGVKPYVCSYCDKSFAQQGDLAAHKRTHTGQRPHSCRFCYKNFIRSSALTAHMKKHRSFETNYYEKSYQMENDLVIAT